jgi:hypothetical protein
MYRITKDGRCAKHLCVIDEVHRNVSTFEDGLVFHFGTSYHWSFKSGRNCTFTTGHNCNFKVGSGCTFNTDSHCVFNTDCLCVFNTAYDCLFRTGYGCTFKVGRNCVLVRWDVEYMTRLPADVTIKLSYDSIGYKVNTVEWVSKYMNNEDGMLIVLKSDEYFDPTLYVGSGGVVI